MTDKKKILEYTNDEITITWEPKKCIHSEKCWRNLGEVFQPKQKPWIKPDAADNDTIIKQIHNCPSGALGVYYNDESKQQQQQKETNKMIELKVNKNGSLKVTGSVKIIMPDGTEEIKEGRFSLCRCGLSNNKPFCDGAHKETNFDENWDI